MKIGVIKLGARIAAGAAESVTSGEAVSICLALARGGAEVHAYSKILSKDKLDPSIVWHEILEDRNTDGLDALFVINGRVNFFGGAEDRPQILNYEIINRFSGPVIYIMCDPDIPMEQIWDNVSKKQADPDRDWKNTYNEADILVTKPINVLCQPFNVEAVKPVWAKKKVPLGEIRHFPMDRFPFLNTWLEPSTVPTVDLLYGGTHRGGKRIPNLYKWYWNLPEDISVELFGKISHEDFAGHTKLKAAFEASKLQRPPVMNGMIKYHQVLPKMNGALAHLVTGDPLYETLDLIPQRVAECIAAGNIVFVDANIDKSRRIYPVGTAANEFLYVKNQEELVERLRAVKADPDLRMALLEEQRIATGFDAQQFCESLVEFAGSFA